MEKKVTCPCCFSDDRCFEEVVNEKLSSWICFNCGMTSNSLYTKNSEEHKQFVENSPMLIKDLQLYDEERKIYWYPTVINMNTLGIIFPEGNVDNWTWKFAKPIEIPEDERKNYPIPEKDGEFYETRLDVENAKTYGRYSFLEALYDMGIIEEL